jgi:hypothetical protein
MLLHQQASRLRPRKTGGGIGAEFQFVATAVAAKLTAMNTVNLFAEIKNRVDYDAF